MLKQITLIILILVLSVNSAFAGSLKERYEDEHEAQWYDFYTVTMFCNGETIEIDFTVNGDFLYCNSKVSIMDYNVQITGVHSMQLTVYEDSYWDCESQYEENFQYSETVRLWVSQNDCFSG